jgi:hypothetical protein
LHAAALFGDATANGDYSGLDAQRVARVAVGLDDGFRAFPCIDPVVVADVTGNGRLSGLDAQRIAQEAVGLDAVEIPPLPQATPPSISGNRNASDAADASSPKIVDLPTNPLGVTRDETVPIDSNAGGQGWLANTAPWDDVEFSQRYNAGELAASPASAAHGRAGVLSDVLHKSRHVFGCHHEDAGVTDNRLPLATRGICDAIDWARGDAFDAREDLANFNSETVDAVFAGDRGP